MVEYNLAKVGVAGSNPVFRFLSYSLEIYLLSVKISNSTVDNGALAQLGERLLCTQEVSGSIPLGSTINSIIAESTEMNRFR